MTASKIVDLRKLLAERFPEEPLPGAERFLTGLPSFDEALAGGLTKGVITELSSPRPNAGSATLLAALLHRACSDRSFIALIDGRDSFDPASLEDSVLRHLLWIRCHHAKEAMQTADLLLRDGNFPLVVLDLVLNPLAELRRIPSSTWYRLQRLVEPAPTAFLVLTPQSMISSAQWKLVLENRWTLPQLDREAPELLGQIGIRARRSRGNEKEIARAS
ncbi:MAG TPA: hypothetical protein VGI85_05235 [Chthoniobacterales bacterium]|jgi:hypothetical protein